MKYNLAGLVLVVVAVALLMRLGHPPTAFPSKTAMPSGPQTAARRAASDEIRAAVFAYQMQHCGPGPYFLAVDHGRDPDDALMAHFASVGASVRKVSAAPGGHSEWGFTLIAGATRWTGSSRVTVVGSYTSDSYGSDDTYVLERRQGRWTVVDDRVRVTVEN